MNNLSKRLLVIAQLVHSNNVADVGCDHGKLAKYLLDNNLVDFVYVSDISQASLNKAIKLLNGYEDKYKSICCDGLVGYANCKINECVISGMGGDEIMKIIANSPIDIDSYILSPQHNEILVKRYMLEHGYNILNDIIIKDKHKFYNIVKYKKIKDVKFYTNSEFDLYFGKDNFKGNADFTEYLEYSKNKIENILKNIKDTNIKRNLEKELELINLAKGRIDSYEKNVGVSSTRY